MNVNAFGYTTEFHERRRRRRRERKREREREREKIERSGALD